MRLTKKQNTKLYPYIYSDIDDTFEGKPINKLGFLEDIEEELDIDLITLFKALNECYTEDGYKGTAMILNNKEIGIKYQLGENSWSSRICKISDYGKTWALTKEELTHEIH